MCRDFERAAAWLRPRVWLAKVAAVLLWSAWILGFVLGQKWDVDPVGTPMLVDHLGFYSAARLTLDGQSASLYDPVTLHDTQRALRPPASEDVYLPFRNPPFFALLYVPTARLPFLASAWVWNAIGLIALALGLRLLRPDSYRQAFGWSLLFSPVFFTISYGQSSLLTVGVFSLTFWLLSANRRFLAGLVVGLLWFKPPLLLGLVIWGLIDIRRWWPAACGVVVTGAGLVGVSYLLIPEAWQGFVHSLASNVTFGEFEWWKMHNARAFWRLLLPGVPVLWEPLWLASVGVGVWGFVWLWLRARDDLPAMFGASILLMLLASPYTMIYEWSLALVPAVLWWREREQVRVAWFVLFAVAWVALFASTQFSQLQDRVQRDVFGVTPIVVQVSVPMLAWVTWRAFRLVGERRASAGPT